MNVAAATGGGLKPLFDSAKAEAALATLPGVGADEARRRVHSRDLIFNGAHSQAIVNDWRRPLRPELFRRPCDSHDSAAGEEQEPTFSPDSSKSRRSFAITTSSSSTSSPDARPRWTADAAATILQRRDGLGVRGGDYGRGTKRAYWWSPDSSRVAFLRIDDTPVSTVRHARRITTIRRSTWQYPRAGDPNPSVTVGVARAAGGATDWIDLSKYGPSISSSAVDWAPTGALIYEVENRTQSWLDLNAANVASSPGQHQDARATKPAPTGSTPKTPHCPHG